MEAGVPQAAKQERLRHHPAATASGAHECIWELRHHPWGTGLPTRVQVHTLVGGHTDTGVSPRTAALMVCEPMSTRSTPDGVHTGFLGAKVAGGSQGSCGPSLFQIVSSVSVWRFLKKLKIELPYDPAIPLLGIYPEKTIIQKESCTTMFIAALLTIARTWKQPKCPSTDEWIKKMWHIYTMEY